MLVEVPEPVWKMSSGNWPSWRPAMTGDACVDDAHLLVDHRRLALDARHRLQEARREGEPGDREVAARALGLRPVVGARRNVDLAQAVFLDSRGGHAMALLRLPRLTNSLGRRSGSGVALRVHVQLTVSDVPLMLASK
jgi:hypothetical protein